LRAGEQQFCFCGDSLRGEVVLDQFRDDFPAGNQVDHAEEFGPHQRPGELGGQRREAVDDDHGLAEQGGFDSGRAAGDDGQVRGGEGVVSFLLEKAHLPLGGESRLQARDVQSGRDGNDYLRRRWELLADFRESLHQDGNVVGDFTATAAGQDRNDRAPLFKTVFLAK